MFYKMNEIDKKVAGLMQIYPCLTLNQVIDTIYLEELRERKSKKEVNKEIIASRVKKSIKTLSHNKVLYFDKVNEIVKREISTPLDRNTRLLDAYWVYLKFKGDSPYQASYMATYPSAINFIKNNSPYRITEIEPNYEFLFVKLMEETKKLLEKNKDNLELQIKHIIMVNNKKTMTRVLEYIKKYQDVISNMDVVLVLTDKSDAPTNWSKPKMKIFKVS